jgi:hypothetical protein
MTTYIIPPTVLYIKQHSITKKKYFGKTTKDPYKYNGSGEYWKNHIKKHGKEHVVTLSVSEPYIDSDTIVEVALAFSKDNNIVESDLWANIIPENGLDGAPKGAPSKKKGKPTGPNKGRGKLRGKQGKQQNPHGPRGPRGPTGPYGKQQNPHGPKGKQQNPAPKIECPHCGLVGGTSAMKRHHFDNCKKKPI